MASFGSGAGFGTDGFGVGWRESGTWQEDKGTRRDSACNYFQRGHCSKGDRCPYRHDVPAGEGGNGNQEREICRNFQVGNCSYGDKCRYIHDLNPSQYGDRAKGSGGFITNDASGAPRLEKDGFGGGGGFGTRGGLDKSQTAPNIGGSGRGGGFGSGVRFGSGGGSVLDKSQTAPNIGGSGGGGGFGSGGRFGADGGFGSNGGRFGSAGGFGSTGGFSSVGGTSFRPDFSIDGDGGSAVRHGGASDNPFGATPQSGFASTGRAVPREKVLVTWYSDESAISAEDLKAHEEATYRIGSIPEDPPPQRFCV